MVEVSSLVDRRSYIVEDDPALRSTIRRILTVAGIYCEEFGTAESLIEGYGSRPLGCILLDIRLPGMSGLDLLQRLKGMSPPNPVIVISGHADLPLAVTAVRSGAIDVLQKPFRKQQLLDVLGEGFELVRSSQMSSPFGIESLSPREREVLVAFADGSPSKVIAGRLSLSVRTVEMHRNGIVKKLGLTNMMQAVLRAKDSGYIR